MNNKNYYTQRQKNDQGKPTEAQLQIYEVYSNRSHFSEEGFRNGKESVDNSYRVPRAMIEQEFQKANDERDKELKVIADYAQRSNGLSSQYTDPFLRLISETARKNNRQLSNLHQELDGIITDRYSKQSNEKAQLYQYLQLQKQLRGSDDDQKQTINIINKEGSNSNSKKVIKTRESGQSTPRSSANSINSSKARIKSNLSSRQAVPLNTRTLVLLPRKQSEDDLLRRKKMKVDNAEESSKNSESHQTKNNEIYFQDSLSMTGKKLSSASHVQLTLPNGLEQGEKESIPISVLLENMKEQKAANSVTSQYSHTLQTMGISKSPQNKLGEMKIQAKLSYNDDQAQAKQAQTQRQINPNFNQIQFFSAYNLPSPSNENSQPQVENKFQKEQKNENKERNPFSNSLISNFLQDKPSLLRPSSSPVISRAQLIVIPEQINKEEPQHQHQNVVIMYPRRFLPASANLERSDTEMSMQQPQICSSAIKGLQLKSSSAISTASDQRKDQKNIYYSQNSFLSIKSLTNSRNSYHNLGSRSQNVMAHEYKNLKKAENALREAQATPNKLIELVATKAYEAQESVVTCKPLILKQFESNQLRPQSRPRINTQTKYKHDDEVFTQSTKLFQYINKKSSEPFENINCQDEIPHSEYFDFIDEKISQEQEKRHDQSKEQAMQAGSPEDNQHSQMQDNQQSKSKLSNRPFSTSSRQLFRTASSNNFNKPQITRRLKKYACKFSSVAFQFDKLQQRSSLK